LVFLLYVLCNIRIDSYDKILSEVCLLSPKCTDNC